MNNNCLCLKLLNDEIEMAGLLYLGILGVGAGAGAIAGIGCYTLQFSTSSILTTFAVFGSIPFINHYVRKCFQIEKNHQFIFGSPRSIIEASLVGIGFGGFVSFGALKMFSDVLWPAFMGGFNSQLEKYKKN